MKLQLHYLLFVALIYASCSSNHSSQNEREKHVADSVTNIFKQKEREKQIADSIAKLLTGKPFDEASNQAKVEQSRNNTAEHSSKADFDAVDRSGSESNGMSGLNKEYLKYLHIEYDYDNKLLNSESDIDGQIFNNSSSLVLKDFLVQVELRNREGEITKSFTHKIKEKASPNSHVNFSIHFEDAKKSKTATLKLIGATKG